MAGSINDDLRAAGLRGCDDEDDIAAGAEALFGSSAAPVDVDASPTVSTVGNKSRVRVSTSDVWLDMEELKRVVNDKVLRWDARCKYCKFKLSAPSTSGTGHLHRHVKSCKKKALAGSSSSQPSLHFRDDGSVQGFIYNSELARSELCRLITRLDLPVSIGKQPAFEDYIRNAHNPRFRHVFRQTTTTDLEKYFELKKLVVVDLVNVATCVCLTSDIWSGNVKKDYLSVVFHFVTDD